MRPMLDLMLVISSIKSTERPSDQAVGGKWPSLESAAHAMASSAGSGVRPQERPMENRTVALNDETVQKPAQVGERGHEFLGCLSDRASAHRRSSPLIAKPTFR